MSRVLVLEHASDTPIGSLGPIMDQRAIPYDVVHVPTDPLPPVADYQAIIALGGPQHVGDNERYPYLNKVEEAIRMATSTDVPYLGICLGGQLLAHALGADVGPHPTPELGFSSVYLSMAGRRDPLFADMPPNPIVFLWHMDAFALPPGGVLLASTRSTRQQAFRYGRRAYGLQFHIEVTADLFALWLHDPSGELIAIRGSSGVSLLTDEWRDNFHAYQEHSSAVFRNFLHISGLG